MGLVGGGDMLGSKLTYELGDSWVVCLLGICALARGDWNGCCKLGLILDSFERRSENGW